MPDDVGQPGFERRKSQAQAAAVGAERGSEAKQQHDAEEDRDDHPRARSQREKQPEYRGRSDQYRGDQPANSAAQQQGAGRDEDQPGDGHGGEPAVGGDVEGDSAGEGSSQDAAVGTGAELEVLRW